MVINMLSRTDDGHRADAAMLDFEDSMKPSWGNVMQGVENVIGAAEGTLSFEKRDRDGEVVKTYELDPDDMPLLMVRVRGLHLDESNLRVDDTPVSGGLLDFALCMLHTAKTLMAKGKTPTYYVPKCEHYREARWWNRLFELDAGAPRHPGRARSRRRSSSRRSRRRSRWRRSSTSSATTRPGSTAAAGTRSSPTSRCLKEHADRVMADRGSIGMNRPWMENYVKHLIARLPPPRRLRRWAGWPRSRPAARPRTASGRPRR